MPWPKGGRARNPVQERVLDVVSGDHDSASKTLIDQWDLHHQGGSVGISTVDLFAKPAAHIDFGDQPTLSGRGLINGLPLPKSLSAWRRGS